MKRVIRNIGFMVLGLGLAILGLWAGASVDVLTVTGLSTLSGGATVSKAFVQVPVTITIADSATETLTNPNLTAGTSWSAANECTLASNEAQWAYVAGGASTLTQDDLVFAAPAVADHWYRFSYTVSNVAAAPAASITTAFALASTSLTLTNGAQTTIFKAAVAPGDFIITSTLTAGQTFTLDSFTLREWNAATDCSLGNIFRINPTSSFNLANPTSPTDGQSIKYDIKQDGTGSRLVVFASKFAFSTDIPSVTLSTGASKLDKIVFRYCSATDTYDIEAVNLGR